MCFYSQDDTRQLETQRSQLTPFLKSVMNALKFELENDGLHDSDIKNQRKKTLFEEIIHEASISCSFDSFESSSKLNTLQMEQHQLALNLK